MEENIDRLPRNALTLYVKLYCKKKENMHIKNKMLKATESWVSLSEDEKQQFIDKLKELQNSHKRTFAEYLKHAEVFMKKKNPKKLIETNISIEDNPKTDNLCSEPANQSPSDITCMEVDANQSNINESNNVFYPKLPVPVPPNIKSAKDLYELIQKKKGTDSIHWNTLSPTEKRRYQNAVLSLKKEYIKRYREYLDCLSSKELFSHYIKTI